KSPMPECEKMPETINSAAVPAGAGRAQARGGPSAPKRKAQAGALYQSKLGPLDHALAGAGCGFKPETRRAAMRFGLFSLSRGWLCSACFQGRDLLDRPLAIIKANQQERAMADSFDAIVI